MFSLCTAVVVFVAFAVLFLYFFAPRSCAPVASRSLSTLYTPSIPLSLFLNHFASASVTATAALSAAASRVHDKALRSLNITDGDSKSSNYSNNNNNSKKSKSRSSNNNNKRETDTFDFLSFALALSWRLCLGRRARRCSTNLAKATTTKRIKCAS